MLHLRMVQVLDLQRGRGSAQALELQWGLQWALAWGQELGRGELEKHWG